jgi:hypothetical protein
MNLILFISIIIHQFIEGILEGHRYLWPTGVNSYRVWYNISRPKLWNYENSLIRPNKGKSKGLLDLHSWRVLHRLFILIATISALFIPEINIQFIFQFILSYLIGLNLYSLAYNKVYYSKWFVDRTKIDSDWHLYKWNIKWLNKTKFHQKFNLIFYTLIFILTYIL